MLKIFESGNVTKFVEKYDNAVWESVLYKYGSYKERTVMCISIQSGCPVGCIFCGTGKKFIKDLSSLRMRQQVSHMIDYISKNLNAIEMAEFPSNCEKFQIMFMSMGEPMLNWKNVRTAIHFLHEDYPNAELLISTIGVRDKRTFLDIINVSEKIDKVGLQFSLHSAWDVERDRLIPYKNKLNLEEIRDYGIRWHVATKRPVYLNFFVSETTEDIEMLEMLKYFSPVVFYLTFSVVCNTTENEKNITDMNKLHDWYEFFVVEGYNARIFNPDDQDDIGAGCGQLWYVQQWLKEKRK